MRTEMHGLTDQLAPSQFLLLSNSYLTASGSLAHHIVPSKVTRMWEVAAQLFDASPEAKNAVSVASSLNNRGYFSSVDYAEYNRDPNGETLKDNKEVRVVLKECTDLVHTCIKIHKSDRSDRRCPGAF